MTADPAYKLVRLHNGAHSIHSVAHGETMHPGLGPQAEAHELYVEQLGLLERVRRSREEFVIWDVGLGAAANALAVLRSTREVIGTIRMVSFEQTLDPLRFAFAEHEHLGYFEGYEHSVEHLLSGYEAEFENGKLKVNWQWRIVDFPVYLQDAAASEMPKPHAILFDPWSPSKNPAMWTAPVFANLFRLLAATRPCALATYSRSTMLRVSLLLAGFHVGFGKATGRKEETTIAANVPELIRHPLDLRWLDRARRSESAEPMWEPTYRQAPLTATTLERLQAHSQFQ